MIDTLIAMGIHAAGNGISKAKGKKDAKAYQEFVHELKNKQLKKELKEALEEQAKIKFSAKIFKAERRRVFIERKIEILHDEIQKRGI